MLAVHEGRGSEDGCSMRTDLGPARTGSSLRMILALSFAACVGLFLAVKGAIAFWAFAVAIGQSAGGF